MKLWIIRQTKNNGYDTYDSAVVAAPDEEAAKMTHPSEYKKYYFDFNGWGEPLLDGRVVRSSDPSWAHPRDVRVEYLGETDRKIQGVILSSFNAG